MKPQHKRLVDAIIDGEVEASELAKRAAELGDSVGDRLSKVTRAIVQARVQRTITAQQAKEAYLRTFRALSLGGFARVAQDVVDHAERSATAVMTEAAKLGADVANVEEIRSPDFAARELEKKGGLNGNTESKPEGS